MRLASILFLFLAKNVVFGQIIVSGPTQTRICPDGNSHSIGAVVLTETNAEDFGAPGETRTITIALNDGGDDYTFAGNLSTPNAFFVVDSSFRNVSTTVDPGDQLSFSVTYTVDDGSTNNGSGGTGQQNNTLVITGINIITTSLGDDVTLEVTSSSLPALPAGTVIANAVSMGEDKTLSISQTTACYDDKVLLSLEPGDSEFDYSFRWKYGAEGQGAYRNISSIENGGNTIESTSSNSLLLSFAERRGFNFRVFTAGNSTCSFPEIETNEVFINIYNNDADAAGALITGTELSNLIDNHPLSSTDDPPIALSSFLDSNNPKNNGQWSGEGIVGGMFNPSVLSGTSQGDALITYSYENSNGCIASESININLELAPDSRLEATILTNGETWTGFPLCPSFQYTIKVNKESNKAGIEIVDPTPSESINTDWIYNIQPAGTAGDHTDDNYVTFTFVPENYPEDGSVELEVTNIASNGTRTTEIILIPLLAATTEISGIPLDEMYCLSETVNLSNTNNFSGRYNIIRKDLQNGYPNGNWQSAYSSPSDERSISIPASNLTAGHFYIYFYNTRSTTGNSDCNVSSKYDFFTIVENPEVDVEIENLNGNSYFCLEDTIEFSDRLLEGDNWYYRTVFPFLRDEVTHSDTVYKAYSWSFGEGEPTDFSVKDSVITHVYEEPGAYEVRLTAELVEEYDITKDGVNIVDSLSLRCPIEFVYPIVVGQIPESDFSYSTICNETGVTFTDASVLQAPATNATDAINSWQYTLQPAGTNLLNTPTGDYLLPPGKHTIQLVTTSAIGCSDTAHKTIAIFGFEDFDNRDRYTEPFDATSTNSTFWINMDTTAMLVGGSWMNTVPTWVTDHNGSEAWAMNYTDYSASNSNNGFRNARYSPEEFSWIESPCFKLSGLDKPMVALDVFFDTEKNLDGVVLQYTEDYDVDAGTETWKTVGAIEDGLNWYNVPYVVSQPDFGEQTRDGWSGKSLNEAGQLATLRAKYNIQQLKDEVVNLEKIVRFRILVTSNEVNSPGLYSGVMVDNFFLGEKNRRILVENFTNSALRSDNATIVQEDSLEKIVASSGGEVNLINYHMQDGYPNADYFHAYTPASVGGRSLFYSIGETNRAAIDGTVEHTPLFAVANPWGTEELETRILEESPFSVGITSANTASGALEIHVECTKDLAVDGPYNVFVAILKDNAENRNTANSIGFADIREYNNVLVELLPNATGIRYDTWNDLETKTIDFTWEKYENTGSGESYKAIAFVQNPLSGEIFQSSEPFDLLTLPPVTPAVYNVNTQFAKFSAPLVISVQETTGEVIPVHLSFAPGAGKQWKLYDLLGKEVINGTLEEAQKTINVDNSTLSSGLYLIKVEGHDAIGKVKVVD